MRNKFIIIAMALACLPVSASAETAKYVMDKSHTNLSFSWNHNRLSDMSGRFLEYDGGFDLDFDRPSNSRVSFTIQANSVWTGIGEMDDVMRSKRLFDVEKFPEITFVSTRVRKTGLERGQLEGDLTIKGITRKVRLDIQLNYQGPHIFAGNVERYAKASQAGMELRTRVNRSQFGLGMAIPWIADEIDIVINTELVANAAEAEPAADAE